MRLNFLSTILLAFTLGGCSSIDSVPLPDNNPEQEVITDDSDARPGDESSDAGESDENGPPSLDCEDGLVQCGSICVDIDADVSNCGSCGRTCVIPNADASCSSVDCTILSCNDGFFDLDLDLAN